jgi:hypothetical protein
LPSMGIHLDAAGGDRRAIDCSKRGINPQLRLPTRTWPQRDWPRGADTACRCAARTGDRRRAFSSCRLRDHVS